MASNYESVIVADYGRATNLLGVRADAPADVFIAAAKRERIDGLLAGKFATCMDLHAGARRAWRDVLHARVAAHLATENELLRVIDAWRSAGVQPLLIKGAALAATHYEHPWQRPYADVDVWCEHEEVDVIGRALEGLGYEPSPHVQGEGIYQVQYERRPARGLSFHVDVHTRMANPQLFAMALSYADAAAEAVPVSNLHGARTPCGADALFIACIHRVAHHNDSPHLIWLYDIHLIASALDTCGWTRFTSTAARARTRGVCRASLHASREAFGTIVPDDVDIELRADCAEPADAFLGGRMREVDMQWSNFQHAPGWRTRRDLAIRHLFPPRDYIRRHYHDSRLWLPLLYVRRIVTGVPKWFARVGGRP